MQFNTAPVESPATGTNYKLNFSDAESQDLILSVRVSIRNDSLLRVGIQDPILNETLVGKSQIVSGFGEISDGLQILRTGEGEDDLENVNEKSSALVIKNSENVSVLHEADKLKKMCDVTKGKWLFDESYPLYTNSSCPFIDEGFDCLGNGRYDKDYMKWRWQPESCDIPR